MSKDWFFGLGENGKTIELRCRAVSEDGSVIGDIFREVGPGGEVDGVGYDELLAAGGGILQIHGGGRHRIVRPPRRQKPG